jgi:uncharacterized protein (TIGR00251 family)
LNEPRSAVEIDPLPDGIALWIHVTPRARTGSVGPAHGDALRVRITAPPVEGRANAACRTALAEALQVPRSSVELAPDARGRRKRVVVRGDPLDLAVRVHKLAARTGLG